MRRCWQTPRAQVDHVDDWLMTYADVITLLLCFFALFLSLSVAALKKAPKEPEIQTISSPLIEAPPEEVDFFDRPSFSPTATGVEPEMEQKEISSEQIVAVQMPLDSLLEIVERLKKQGPAAYEPKGERIQTIEMDSATFFASGAAILSETGKNVLKDVASRIKADTFKDYQITVEGHTDDQPINTSQFPSNWELSTARAAAVVHFFLDQGIEAQRLRAAGYADSFPKAPNRDEEGQAIPSHQAQNRRVVIKLEKIDKPKPPVAP